MLRQIHLLQRRTRLAIAAVLSIRNGRTRERTIQRSHALREARAVKPAQRIENTLRAYELVKSWPWAKMLAVWAFRYPWPARTYQGYFTLVTPEFDPKPIYLELQRYSRGEEAVRR